MLLFRAWQSMTYSKEVEGNQELQVLTLISGTLLEEEELSTLA